MPLEVTGVSIDAGYKRLTLADGRELVARTILAATGMVYREHAGRGRRGAHRRGCVLRRRRQRKRRRSATGACSSSAEETPPGQARHVPRPLRERSAHRRAPRRFARTMSHYLIDQIKKTPKIQVRARTEIERVEGDGHVQRLGLKSVDDGSSVMEEADALFVFIGTRPQSDWLPPDVLRDAKGFVLTGRDLMAAEPYRAHVEGITRTAAAGNERSRGFRRRRHPRQRDEPGGISGRRRSDDGATRARISRADVTRVRNRTKTVRDFRIRSICTKLQIRPLFNHFFFTQTANERNRTAVSFRITCEAPGLRGGARGSGRSIDHPFVTPDPLYRCPIAGRADGICAEQVDGDRL